MECFGCELRPGHEKHPKDAAFPGTLFRFPLRTAEQASTTELRPNATYDAAKIALLFDDFKAKLPESLLFMQNLEEVELLEWHQGVSDG